jgi:hypothetical protein
MIKVNKIFKNRVFYLKVLLLTLVLFNVILIVKNFSYAYASIGIGINIIDSLSTIYDISNTFNFYNLIITLVSTLLISISLIMLYQYLVLEKGVTGIKKIGTGMILAIIASHCASCGAAILGGLISVSLLTALPFAGNEIGVLAIFVLLYTIYDMNNKLNNPYVC